MGLPDNMSVSIAEHSYAVAYLSMIFAKIIKVDDGRLIKYSLVHDWTDCIIGDLPSGSPSWRSFWKTDIRQDTKIAESNAMAAIVNLIKDEADLSDIGIRNLNETERKLLGAADLTAMLLEMLEWKYLGIKHNGWEMVWFNTIDRLKKIELDFIPDLVGELNGAYKKENKEAHVFLAKPEKQTNPDHKL